MEKMKWLSISLILLAQLGCQSGGSGSPAAGGSGGGDPGSGKSATVSTKILTVKDARITNGGLTAFMTDPGYPNPNYYDWPQQTGTIFCQRFGSYLQDLSGNKYGFHSWRACVAVSELLRLSAAAHTAIKLEIDLDNKNLLFSEPSFYPFSYSMTQSIDGSATEFHEGTSVDRHDTWISFNCAEPRPITLTVAAFSQGDASSTESLRKGAHAPNIDFDIPGMTCAEAAALMNTAILNGKSCRVIGDWKLRHLSGLECDHH
jgi:hypothetical protein